MLQLPPFLYLASHAALYGGAVAEAALDLDFTDMEGVLDPRITFSRASIATYFNSAGVLSTAASGAARFDYDPVTLAPRGLLMEIGSSNSAIRSQEFDNASWTKTGATVTANNTTAPDSTTTADRINSSASPASVSAAIGASAGQPYVASVFAKKGTSDWFYLCNQVTGTGAATPKAWFNLNTGVTGTIDAGITSATIQNVGGGWYRCSAAGVGGAGTEWWMAGICDADASATVTVGRTAYLWGAQFEVNTLYTSYIPTTTTLVTRAADAAVMTGANFSSWFNASAGTFVAEFALFLVSGTRGVLSADNNAVAESIRLYGSGTDPKVTIMDGGITQADLDVGTLAANTIHKLGVSYASNDIAGCLDGGAIITDVAATMPTPTQMQIGVVPGTTNSQTVGHIRRLQYWNTAKSDADLAALTVVAE